MTDAPTEATELGSDDLNALLAMDRQEVIECMVQSLDLFAAVALPQEFTKPFSDIHRNMWTLLTKAVMKGEGIDRYALGIPRGHAKTTLLKLLSLFIILFTTRRFILVVCSTATKAQAFVDDITLLLDSPNIIELFGDWRGDIVNDNEKIKRFYYLNRSIIIKPQGVGGSVRGTSVDFRRPDTIICDDIQEREDAENEVQSSKLLDWFLSTLYKAKDPSRCTFVYVGNMYPDLEMGERGSGLYCCLLRNLQLNDEWTSWIVGGILADGTALWEEVHPISNLLADLRQDQQLGREHIFFAEVMNDPGATTSPFYDPNKVPGYPYNDAIDTPVGKYMVIDPSLGKKKSDDQYVGLYYVYDDKGPVLRKLERFQTSAPNLVQEVLKWALKEQVPLVCAESVAYQGTLLQWFIFFCEQSQIEGIHFMPVTPKGFSKASRILAYFKSLHRGTSIVHPDCRALVDHQAAFYKPTEANNRDDILDVGAYGEQAYLEYSEYYLLPLDAVVVGSSFEDDEDDAPALLANVRIP